MTIAIPKSLTKGTATMEMMRKQPLTNAMVAAQVSQH
jgi:hypothetical protein